MKPKESTERISKIINRVAASKGYQIADNRRLLVNTKPPINYQPDFLLMSKEGIFVIEMEITTDAIKQVIGDIVRAGLLGSNKFIAVVINAPSKNLIEKYGKALCSSIGQLKTMQVLSILYENDKSFERTLKELL